MATACHLLIYKMKKKLTSERFIRFTPNLTSSFSCGLQAIFTSDFLQAMLFRNHIFENLRWPPTAILKIIKFEDSRWPPTAILEFTEI